MKALCHDCTLQGRLQFYKINLRKSVSFSLTCVFGYFCLTINGEPRTYNTIENIAMQTAIQSFPTDSFGNCYEKMENSLDYNFLSLLKAVWCHTVAVSY